MDTSKFNIDALTGQSVFCAGGKYTNSQNTDDGRYDPDPSNIAPSFNAVEIDWNGIRREFAKAA